MSSWLPVRGRRSRLTGGHRGRVSRGGRGRTVSAASITFIARDPVEARRIEAVPRREAFEDEVVGDKLVRAVVVRAARGRETLIEVGAEGVFRAQRTSSVRCHRRSERSCFASVQRRRACCRYWRRRSPPRSRGAFRFSDGGPKVDYLSRNRAQTGSPSATCRHRTTRIRCGGRSVFRVYERNKNWAYDDVRM